MVIYSITLTGIIVFIVDYAAAQVGRVGKCPELKGMADFQFDKYTNGTWYELAKFFTIVETKCVSLDFIPHNQTTLVVSNALEKMILPSPVTRPIPAQLQQAVKASWENMNQRVPRLPRPFRHLRQTGSQVQQTEPIYTPIKIVGFVAEKIPPSTIRFNYTEGVSMPEYRILETDYNNYAVIWSCNEMFNGVFHNQFISILGRSRQADQELIRRIVANLQNTGIETAHIVAADQIRCDS